MVGNTVAVGIEGRFHMTVGITNRSIIIIVIQIHRNMVPVGIGVGIYSAVFIGVGDSVIIIVNIVEIINAVVVGIHAVVGIV